MFKEDNVLYPMAGEALSKEVKEEINMRFRKLEAEMSEKRDKYISFVKKTQMRKKDEK